MAVKVKISEYLKKSLHKDSARNYEREELEKLQSMNPLSENQDYKTERLVENQFYNILSSKIANELGIPKNKIKKFVRTIKIDKFAKRSNYNWKDKIITIKIPTDSKGNYKIDDNFLGKLSNSIGAEMGHALKFKELPKGKITRNIDDFYHDYYDRVGQHAAKEISKNKNRTFLKPSGIDYVEMLNKLTKNLDEIRDKVFLCSDEKYLEELKKYLEIYKNMVDKLSSDRILLSEDYLGHIKYYAIADLMVKKFGIKDAYSKSPKELEEIIKNNQQIKKESRDYLENISKMPQDPEEFKNELKTKIENAYSVYNIQKSHFESENSKYLLKNDSASMPVPGVRFIQKIIDKKTALKEKKLKKAGNLNTIEGRAPQSIAGANMADARQSLYRRLMLRYHPDRGGDPEKFIGIQNAYRSTTTLEEFQSSLRKMGISLGYTRPSPKTEIIPLGYKRPSPKPASYYFHKKEGTSSQETRREDIPLLPPHEKNEALEEIMSMGRAVEEGIRPPTQEESKKEDNKLAIYKKSTGGDKKQKSNAKCPKCNSRDVDYEGEGIYHCKNCDFSGTANEFFSTSTGEGAFSGIIHSSYMPVAVATFIGLMIPVIFGANIGTALVCVGIIFLGLSKI